MYAGDREREQAAAALREHYVRGRLTFDELSHRVGRVLTARSRGDLRRALSGLPRFDTDAAPPSVRSVARGALLVVATGAYLVFCLALLLMFAFTLLIAGASTAVVVTFLLLWGVPTYVLTRLWHRPAPRRRASI